MAELRRDPAYARSRRQREARVGVAGVVEPERSNAVRLSLPPEALPGPAQIPLVEGTAGLGAEHQLGDLGPAAREARLTALCSWASLRPGRSAAGGWRAQPLLHLIAFTGSWRALELPGEMASCEEARSYLVHCGFTRLDGDEDGVPCKELCR